MPFIHSVGEQGRPTKFFNSEYDAIAGNALAPSLDRPRG